MGCCGAEEVWEQEVDGGPRQAEPECWLQLPGQRLVHAQVLCGGESSLKPLQSVAWPRPWLRAHELTSPLALLFRAPQAVTGLGFPEEEQASSVSAWVEAGQLCRCPVGVALM